MPPSHHVLSKRSLPEIMYHFYIEQVKLIPNGIKLKNRLNVS